MRRLIMAGLAAVLVLGVIGSRPAAAQQQVSFSIGGFTFRRFWRTAWAKLGWARKRMNPAMYSWPHPSKAGEGAAVLLQ